MANVTIDLVGEWDRALKATNPGHFRRRLKTQMKLSLAASARFLARKQRDLIKGAGGIPEGPPLSALTQAITGRSMPLRGKGGLTRAMKGKSIAWNSAFAGIEKSSTDGALYRRALRFHYGSNSSESPGVQLVTRKMQMMFMRIKAFAENRSQKALTGRALEIYSAGSGRVSEWRIPALLQPIQVPAATAGRSGWDWANKALKVESTKKTVRDNAMLALSRAIDPKAAKAMGQKNRYTSR